MLTNADEGGRGVKPKADHCSRGGEGGVQEPLILADVICEPPFTWVAALWEMISPDLTNKIWRVS